MSVPVLVVTGFLGAGKTTFVNSLLTAARDRRIAAIVNDFGSINVDAELIAERAEGVIGLTNGCVCCSLQGDLLRTLKTVLTQGRRPDNIVIEASGAADPRGIVEVLADPVLWKSVRHDAVACIVDAEDVVADPGRREDRLWLAQVASADFIGLAKSGGLPPEAVTALRRQLSPDGHPPLFDLSREQPDPAVLFGVEPRAAPDRPAGSALRTDAGRFVSAEWRSEDPIPVSRLQAVLDALAPMIVRAKGLFRFSDRPGEGFVLQMVGRRARITPAPAAVAECRLVVIGEAEKVDTRTLRGHLARLGDSS